MKRIISFLCILLLLSFPITNGFVSSAQETDTEVTAYIDVTQKASSTLDITLYIIPNRQMNITGMFFSINYASVFGYEYSEFPFIYNKDKQDTNFISDKRFSSATITNNPLLHGSFYYIWDSTSAVPIPAGEEITLATITLDIAEPAYTGTYIFSLSCSEFCCSVSVDGSDEIILEDVSVDTSSGVFPFYLEERPDTKYGDSNNDGEIDTKDLVLLRQYLANFNYDTGSSTVEIADGGDANGDNVIDTKDLVLLRRYLANYDYDTGTSTVTLGPQR